MCRIAFACVLMIVLAGLCVGCVKTGASRSGIRYPSTWPIAELTVPAGCKQLKMPAPGGQQRDEDGWGEDGVLRNEGTDHEIRSWELAFEYGGSPADLQHHIDECLKPLGFELWRAVDIPAGHRHYITKDRKRQVLIEYLDLQPNPMGGFTGWQGYRLGVAFWTHGRPDIASTQPIP